jgi:predicted transcriptional regulator
MKTAKDEVRELLENLPDEASLEDIQYHLYARQKIQRGLEAAEEGRTITHEEAVRRMSRWLEM